MAYVDLNPVRAGIASTPEASHFTSVYARIQALRSPTASGASNCPTQLVRLLACRDQARADAASIPITLRDYLQLIDWSGRIVRKDKRGAIEECAPPILVRLNIDPEVWREAMRIRGNVFGRALGRLDHLRLHARALGQAWIKGQTHAQRLYRHA